MRNKSDHKHNSSLFEWKYSNIPKHRPRIVYELLYGKIHKQYKVETEKYLQKQPSPKNIQQKWTNIVTVTTRQHKTHLK